MRRIIQVRALQIGDGVPKICASLFGKTDREIQENIRQGSLSSADLLEWRADTYADIYDSKKRRALLGKVCQQTGGKPLLFTFRREQPQGKQCSQKQYEEIVESVLETGEPDFIDLEDSTEKGRLLRWIAMAREVGVKTLLSYHNFATTPEKDWLIAHMRTMQEMGADCIKIAVMPQSEEDVALLTEAVATMLEKYAVCPVIGLSMSKMGLPSRLQTGTLATAITFGKIGRESAPGQLEVETLRRKLDTGL